MNSGSHIAVTGLGAWLRGIAVGVLGAACSIPTLAEDAETNAFREPLEVLESSQMARLARVQADRDAQLAPFTTDGCSGGMSDTWQRLSDQWPGFRERFGAEPPWQYCCVAHDRAYWRGDTNDGYAERKRADRRLEACVRETGLALSEELAANWNTRPEVVETLFDATAKLMYRAVRLGGRPCSVFPWRWGYGWPPCPAESEDL